LRILNLEFLLIVILNYIGIIVNAGHGDWNGARNILLRALQATAITLTGDAILIQGFQSFE
jgi:hypothetical protein